MNPHIRSLYVKLRARGLTAERAIFGARMLASLSQIHERDIDFVGPSLRSMTPHQFRQAQTEYRSYSGPTSAA